MPGTIIVAGIPGVGKTTVLQEVEKISQEKRVPLKIVNFGSVMNQLFNQSGRELHRDHMRRQDISLQSKIQLEAARQIRKMARTNLLIVDTHMFVRTNDGLWPGTPEKVLEALGPDAIILIEAEPEEIAKRRAQDTTRKERQADQKMLSKISNGPDTWQARTRSSRAYRFRLSIIMREDNERLRWTC